jgi:hypothetical protein
VQHDQPDGASLEVKRVGNSPRGEAVRGAGRGELRCETGAVFFYLLFWGPVMDGGQVMQVAVVLCRRGW